MKNITILALLVIVTATGCVPQTSTPEVQPTADEAPSAPAVTQECTFTPAEIAAQGIAIPAALIIRGDSGEGLSLAWRDGTLMGSWQTGGPVEQTFVHAAAPIADGVEATPLVFVGANEDGTTSLRVSLGGEVTTLRTFSTGVTVTGLTGIPGQAWVAYTTLEAGEAENSLVSRAYLAEWGSLAEAEPRLSRESDQSLALLPVAIHQAADGTPDGLWYTFRAWGIGGDSLTDPRMGLYYQGLGGGEALEVLSTGCQFSSLSAGQTWAAWFDEGSLHAAEIRTGQEITTALASGYDRAAHAFFSPSEGYAAWLEGRGWGYDETLETVLRVRVLQGEAVFEFPLATIGAGAGLEEVSGMMPLGWLAPDNEVVLVAVYFESGRSVVVMLDPNTGETRRLAEGTVVGFAYP